MHFAPGDPVGLALGDIYTEEQYAAKAAELGLDQPFLVQLWVFIRNIFMRFDFGTSWVLKTHVGTELFARLPRTLTLAGISCILEILIGIPLGITAATHKGGFVDKFCIFLAMVGISLPGFWIALMMILLFSNTLGWLPSSGVDHWYCYIMPCIANALTGIGGLTRVTRSQMLEVINADYVVTARAKGVPERTILYSHALPNALIPVVTHVGTHFATAIGGSVVIETVFSIPGIGFYITQSLGNRDYPIVTGGVTLLALIFCIIILLIDILYAYIDPRIKAQYESSGKSRKVKRALKAKGAAA